MRRPITFSGILAITSALLLAGGYIWFRSGASITTDSGQSGSPRVTPSTGVGPTLDAPLPAPNWVDSPDHFGTSKSAIIFPPLEMPETEIAETERARQLLPSSKLILLDMDDALAGHPESTPSQTATATATATPTSTPTS